MNTLLRWLWSAIDSIPCRTTRAVGAAYVEGFLKGTQQIGLTRDARGRFVSLHPKPFPFQGVMIPVSKQGVENRAAANTQAKVAQEGNLFT